MESTNITHTSFEDTCRVCLAKNGALVDIFRCQNRNIPEEIHYCSGVLVNVSDNLPPNICVACLKELSVACKFKQKCLKADEVFRQVLVVEQVEYLEDYFQVTEQEHGSTIYVADIDKENSEITSSSKDEILSKKNELQDLQKVHSQDKRIYACDKCPSKYSNINNYWRHMRVEHGGHSKENKSAKIEFEVINSSEHLSNKLIKEIHYEDKTEEITETVEDCVYSDYLTDNENSAHSLRDDENLKTKQTTEQNSTLNRLQKVTNIENVEDRDDKNLKTKEITEQIDTLTMPKEVRIVLQDALIGHVKTPKIKENTEQNSTLETVQKSKNIEMQAVENLEGVLKKDKTKNTPSLSTPKISKTAEITEQTSTLQTIQNRTKIEVQELYKNVKKHDLRIKIDKINNVPFGVTTRAYKCRTCKISVGNAKAYYRHRMMFHADKIQVTCEMCNMQLCNRASYRSHLRLHDTSAPLYCCNSCGYKSKYKSAVIKHMNIHSGVIKFTCDYCTKDFLEKSTLKCHISRIHLNIKYPCSICYKKFYSKWYLKKHIKIHERSVKKQPNVKIEKKEQRTENKPYKCTPKISNTEEIKEQLSKLKTEQKRTIIRDVPSNVKQRVYKCLKCAIIFDNRSAYVRHRYAVHDTQRTCEICNTQIPSRSFNSHMARHNRPQYFCEVCDFKTASENTLLQHMNKHLAKLNIILKIDEANDINSSNGTPKTIKREEIIQNIKNVEGRLKMDKRVYKCLKCDMSFDDRNVYLRHSNSLHRKLLTCEICGKQYTSRTMKRHMFTHTGPQYFCDVCQFKTLYEKSFQLHMNRHSETIKSKTTCDYCKKEFVKKSVLRNHILRFHLKAWESCCTLCNKTFDIKSELRIHKRDVHDEKHVCEICGKQFRSIVTLLNHKLIHGAPQIKCDVCGYETVRKNDLIKHMNIHSGRIKYTCEHCKRDFTFKQNLLAHTRRVHLKNKKYKCTSCDKQFISKHELNHHLVGHAAVKSYFCDHCPSGFVRYKGYKKHLKKQHGVIFPKLKPGRKSSYNV